MRALFVSLLVMGVFFSACDTTFDDNTTPPSIGHTKMWAGSGISFLVKPADGTLWGTGNGTMGLGGVNSTDIVEKFTQVIDANGAPITNVKDITFGSNGAVWLLKNDGSLWGAGVDYNGSLGKSDYTTGHPEAGTIFVNRFTPLKYDDGTAITGVSTIGGRFFIKDGELWVSGTQGYGELGLGGNNTAQNGFIKVTVDADGNPINGVEAVFNTAKDSSFFVKSNGDVYACGYNRYGQLGIGSVKDNAADPPRYGINKFTRVTSLTNVKKIETCGTNYVIALKKDGTVWGAGKNNNENFGMSGSGNLTNFTQLPTDGSLEGPPMTDIIDIEASSNTVGLVLLKKDGTVWFANGSIYVGMNVVSGEPQFKQVKDLYNNPLTGVRAITTGSTYTFYLLEDENVLAVGLNSSGGLSILRPVTGDTGLRLEDVTDFTPNLIQFDN